jgi:hypothetical protein
MYSITASASRLVAYRLESGSPWDTRHRPAASRGWSDVLMALDANAGVEAVASQPMRRWRTLGEEDI